MAEESAKQTKREAREQKQNAPPKGLKERFSGQVRQLDSKSTLAVILLGGAAAIVLFLLLYNGWQWLGGGDNGRSTTTATNPTSDPWERIQTDQRLIVGTNATQPPFSYYDTDQQFTGFDIALINEIGDALGVEVIVRDLAFDGLATAVANNHIDLAIAAIPLNDQTASLFSFTTPYYSQQEAILARPDFAVIEFSQISEIAAYRVGVSDGSPFDHWLQTRLIDTGQMPPHNLFRYPHVDQAVADLHNGRLDLIIVNTPTGEQLLNSQDLKVVGHNLSEQHYAIGLNPQAAPRLQTELNNIIASLHENGRLTQLAQTYLDYNSDIPMPLALITPGDNPIPTATAAPCTHDMRLVSQLTLGEDGLSQLTAGRPFRVGWRVQNSGSCPWDSTVRLVAEANTNPSARITSPPQPIAESIPPNATYDIYLDLIAPLQAGTYQQFWTLETADGRKFGERLPFSGTISPHPTPTPAPQTAVADINFTADSDRIQAGECVAFSWDAPPVQAMYFAPHGSDWATRPVALQGGQIECPPATTRYDLRLVHDDETETILSHTIYVTTAVDRPQIDRFTVNPHAIAVGQCVDLRWHVSGDVAQVHLYHGGVLLAGDVPLNGTSTICPDGPGTLVFTLEAVGAAGYSYGQQHVTILPELSATPPPFNQPIINRFTATPSEIPAGQCLTLSWEASGGAEFVRLSRDGQVMFDGRLLYASLTDCFDTPGTHTYRLEAISFDNQTTAVEQTVTVTP